MLSKNVINEVIKEWSWRVPNGMPDISKSDHLNILKDVLVTDFNASMYTVNQVIHKLNEKKSTSSAGNKQFKDEKNNSVISKPSNPEIVRW